MPPRSLVALLSLVASAAAGCASGTAPPTGEPELVGTVASSWVGNRRAKVLVTDVRMPAVGYGAGVDLDVTVAAIYVRQSRGALVRATRAALVPGVGLRVWSTGTELQSLPPQWTAVRVEVTPALAP